MAAATDSAVHLSAYHVTQAARAYSLLSSTSVNLVHCGISVDGLKVTAIIMMHKFEKPMGSKR